MDKLILPNNWNEVSCIQFLDIKNLNMDMTFFLRQLNILSILSGKEVDDMYWDDMYVDDLSNAISQLKWITSLPPNIYKKKINKLTCKDFNTLTLGEFIDIDYYFSQNQFENLPKICAILYRQTKLDEWNNLIYEPYEFDIEARSELFYDISIADIYGILNAYYTFRQSIVNNYYQLFNPILDNEENLDDEDLDDPYVQKEIEKEKMQQKWAWDSVLHKLTDGDITKENGMYDLPLIFILNKLSYKKLFDT